MPQQSSNRSALSSWIVTSCTKRNEYLPSSPLLVTDSTSLASSAAPVHTILLRCPPQTVDAAEEGRRPPFRARELAVSQPPACCDPDPPSPAAQFLRSRAVVAAGSTHHRREDGRTGWQALRPACPWSATPCGGCCLPRGSARGRLPRDWGKETGRRQRRTGREETRRTTRLVLSHRRRGLSSARAGRRAEDEEQACGGQAWVGGWDPIEGSRGEEGEEGEEAVGLRGVD